VKVDPREVRDPCSSAHVLSAMVTSNFRVQSALRGVPLRGSHWAQPAAVQKSSKGRSWYHCLWGLKMIDFGQ